MSAAQLVEEAVQRRVVVYGSPPPEGRDLDLLVRPAEREAIEAALLAAGFARRGSLFVHFGEGSPEIVELSDAHGWDLPDGELDALFEQARPLPGFAQLVRPAPPHDLLILARRVVGEDGVLDAKRRHRVAQALSEDEHAWEAARERAEAWHARMALAALEHAYGGDLPAPAQLLAAARRERGAASPRRRRLRLRVYEARQALARLPRPGRGTVIAFSGLDGSGKSSQASTLKENLERLGMEAVVVRTRISWDDWLWALVPRVKRVIAPLARARLALGRGRARTASSSPARPAADTPAPDGPAAGGATVVEPAASGDPVRHLREQSTLLTDAWTVAITLANAWSQWRLTYRHLLKGKVVICDRYTLDSLVELRHTYGEGKDLKPLRAALARLYPKPARAYLLDVTPETSLIRKGEWGIEWLTAIRRLYLEEHESLGVKLLDGERPAADLAGEIVAEVWLHGG